MPTAVLAEEHSARITSGDSELSGGIPKRMRCGFEMRDGDGLQVLRHAGFEVRITGGIHANTQPNVVEYKLRCIRAPKDCRRRCRRSQGSGEKRQASSVITRQPAR